MRRAFGVLLLALGALLGTVAVAPTPAHAQDDTSATATASVDDTTLEWGSTAVVRGSGFRAGARIRIILYAGNHTLGDFAADANGSFSRTVTIPSDIPSSPAYQLTVQGIGADDKYGYISLPLTITGPPPAVSIANDTLGWEQTTTVFGERYQAGATITVSLFPNNTILGTGSAGSDGRVAVDITIPRDLPSAPNYQLAVTGIGIDSIFHFDVIELTIIGDRPTVDVESTDVPRGGTAVVHGQLFGKGSEVEFLLLPGFEKLGAATVGPDGRFTASVTIPADAFARDPHALVVTGYGIDGIFTFDQTLLRIDGPEAGDPTPGPTVTTLAPVTGDPPRIERFVDRILGSGPEREPTDPGGSSAWLVVLILVGLALLLMFLTRRRPRR